NGSSSSSTFGSVARQRASATRCCWPPESCRGLRVANSLMWTSARHLGDARSNALARPFVRLEAVGDVLGDRHVREQCGGLEYDAGAAPAWRQMVDGFAVEQHAAAALADEAGDDAQQRGLAAAGGAEQRDELASRDVEIDVAHGDEVAKAMADILESQPVPA